MYPTKQQILKSMLVDLENGLVDLLDQVDREAYDKGYDDGYDEGYEDGKEG